MTAAGFLAACSTEEALTGAPAANRPSLAVGMSGNPEAALASYLNAVNLALESRGAGYRVAMAEYVTTAEGDHSGGTVFAKDVGNKQLGYDFVPRDPRRTGWSGAAGAGDDITYAVDQTVDAVPVLGGLTDTETTAAIQRAMTTWDNVKCSGLAITQTADYGLDVGVVAYLAGTGGSPYIFADIQHAGWRDLDFGGGILGVTFTFNFTAGGVATDLDGDGRLDVAFREIYYDPSWTWAEGANIDVESVALHEAGHGLSQAHFGTVRLKNDGTIKASPRAVMNAAYTAPLQALQASDDGGHCANWGAWPVN